MKRSLLNFLIISLFCLSSLEAANSHKKTVCLNMIVKNESHVIKRCLDSVLPFIDSWVIVDTGSTDGTQKVIRDYLKNIPGELYERPWVNFGHNRDEALQLAKGVADYILFMDADDALAPEKGFVLPDLTADCYLIASHTKDHSTEYLIPRFVKDSIDWRWEGVLHEYVTAPSYKSEVMKGIHYSYLSGGARSRDPNTYLNDIKILKDALKKEPNNVRYVFYLAQSYLCAGDIPNALKTYEKRADMGGWAEEVYWSKLQKGRLQERLKMDYNVVTASYLDAHKYRPTRIESLYYMAVLARMNQDYQKSYETTKKNLKVKMPNDSLFVEKWIYDYGMLFEYSISSYWVGQYQESLEACDSLLKMKNLPEEYREATISNRKFSVKKLKKSKPKQKSLVLAVS